MKIKMQGSYINTVRRISENECLSEAVLLESDFEGSASLIYRPDTFEIVDARWAIHRASDPERRGEGVAELLIGESAYIDDHKNSIRTLPDYTYCVDYHMPPGGWKGVEPHKTIFEKKPRIKVSPAWENIKELFQEALRGAYQAEEYLVKERGYESLFEFETSWRSQRAGYCRAFDPNNMPALELKHIHKGNVQHCHVYDLYNKYINFILMEIEDCMTYALGAYHDGAQEMNMEFRLDSEGIILEYDINAVRVPFNVCWEWDHLNPPELKGMNMLTLSKRDIGRIIGGSSGCFHLVDIVADIVTALKKAIL